MIAKLLAPGSGSSEYKVVLIGLLISGCWILGLDVQPFIALIFDGPTTELIGTIAASHARGDWEAVVGMWLGISTYTGVRGWLKSKCPSVPVTKPKEVLKDGKKSN